ncbi:unnamed protein product [Durusdinium trenchii]|uniref:Mitochondrial proton/calcium exchanger protein n=1 Tax=Durusdinium trenchii TaxID=1381693 RepID=A0ABP0SZE0_9DINO
MKLQRPSRSKTSSVRWAACVLLAALALVVCEWLPRRLFKPFSMCFTPFNFVRSSKCPGGTLFCGGTPGDFGFDRRILFPLSASHPEARTKYNKSEEDNTTNRGRRSAWNQTKSKGFSERNAAVPSPVGRVEDQLFGQDENESQAEPSRLKTAFEFTSETEIQRKQQEATGVSAKAQEVTAIADWLQDPKLLETLRQAPRSADARFKLAQRVRGLRGLREEGTTNSSSEKLGAYAGRRYSQKVSCAAALELMRLLWRGALRLPHELELELANTGATFLASLDSDQDSELSLDEFIEFAAVLVQLSDTRVSEVASELDQMVAKPAFLSALGLILRQLSDSIDMLSADIRYSCRLLAKSFQGPLQSLETCWLKRAASDAVTLVPFTAICALPLPFAGHAGLFWLIKTTAPKLLPSCFSPLRLQLAQARHDVRKHPDFKDWRLYGEASEELDAAVVAIFQQKESSAASGSIRQLFEELDDHGIGSLNHSAVLSIVQSLWSGRLNLPKQGMEDFRMDASALMVVVDRRRSGSLTLGEFTEYIQTLVEVARTYDANLQDGNGQQTMLMQDVYDSFFTLLRDIRYGMYVLKKRLQRRLRPLEQAMLKRTTQDVLSILPYLLVARMKLLTPALKILLCMILWKNVPALSPSASTKPRRRFARAWASIAVKQRTRALAGWERRHYDGAGEVMDSMPNEETRRLALENLFTNFDEGSGTLTYGQVFAIAKPIMEKYSLDVLDALGLVIQIASDTDGAVTKSEFVEFMSSLEEMPVFAKNNTATLSEPLATRLKRLSFEKVKDGVKKEVRELVDSVSMVSQDLSYSAALLRSPSPEGMTRFSETESAWLWRTLKDMLLFLPVGAIIVAPLTPVGTAIVIAIFKRLVPSLVPSSFRRPRLNLMSARRTAQPEKAVEENARRRQCSILRANHLMT